MRLSGRNTRRRNTRKKTRMNFTAIFVIIIISILAGYLTTQFIVYPIVGENDTSIFTKLQKLFYKDEMKQNQQQEEPEGANSQENDSKVVDDGLTIEDVIQGNTEDSEGSAIESGYSIQYGSFSTREAAAQLVSQLGSSGITAEIVEKDGAYKVLGKLFATKEEAASAIEQIDREAYPDVFIAERQESK